MKIVGCICTNTQFEALIGYLISEIGILDVVNYIVHFVLNKIWISILVKLHVTDIDEIEMNYVCSKLSFKSVYLF